MNYAIMPATLNGAVPAEVHVVENASVSLYAAAQPAEFDTLVPAEREVAQRLGGRARAEFLRGRAALKGCLGALGLNTDTSILKMPHRNLSLTHAANVAVAAYTAANQVIGVGVDYEPHGPIAGRLARFFLTERELQGRIDEPQHGDALLRVWTVKEALFKATHDNDALTVRDYEAHDVWAWQGSASLLPRPDTILRYITMSVLGGLPVGRRGPGTTPQAGGLTRRIDTGRRG